LEQTNYRAKLLWTPSDKWSVLASYWYWKHETFSTFANDDYEFTPTYLDLVTLEQNIPAPANSVFADSKNELYGLTIRYEGDAFTFSSSTSYFENPVQEGQPIAGFQTDSDFSTQETFAQEFKFTSISDGPWNWTIGAIYLDMKNQEDAVTFGFSEFFPEPVVVEETSDRFTSESWAIFGESIHEFGDHWEFTLGLRYFADERDLEEINLPREPLLEALGIENPNSADFDKLTGRVNLAWTPTGDSLYYANIAQGFRSGGLNSPSAILDGEAIGIDLPSEIDPDLVTSYELGGKWVMLDGSLNLESAIYYLEWEDIQTFTVFVGPQGNATGGALNGESATVLGFELGVTYVVGGLTLSASGNYNDNEYDGAIAGSGVEDGDPITNVPDLTWNLSGTYNWPMGELNGLAFLSATYTDKRTDYFPPASRFTTDDVTFVSGRLGVEAERWSAYLTGENLTDEDGAVSTLAVLDEFGIPPYRFRPRTFGIELNYNF
ncbi:MAG: TonB-dependent receptor, partial [Pseudomonadota bacterium]